MEEQKPRRRRAVATEQILLRATKKLEILESQDRSCLECTWNIDNFTCRLASGQEKKRF